MALFLENLALGMAFEASLDAIQASPGRNLKKFVKLIQSTFQ